MSRFLAFFLLPATLLLSSCEKVELEGVAGENADANALPQPEQQPKEQKRDGIFNKVTGEIVDVKKALAENPNLRIFKREGLGSDPLSQYTNAYIYLRSEIQMLNMKNELKIMKALNDFENLSYKEFMQFVKKHNFQFVMLKPWQMYGYDEDTGQMMILQDEGEKKRRFKEAGIEDQYQEGTL